MGTEWMLDGRKKDTHGTLHKKVGSRHETMIRARRVRLAPIPQI